MKTKLLLSAWLLAGVLTGSVLTSCSDSDEKTDDSLTVSMTSANIGCDGETFYVSVSCESPWSVSASGAWITVKPSHQTGNGNVEVKVAPNEGEDRRGEIYFYVKDFEQPAATISVVQSKLGEHAVSISPMVVALENGNLESEVNIAGLTHNWTFEIAEGDEWMEVSKSDSKLQIKADILRIPYRTGLINVIHAGEAYPVYVVQGDFRDVDVKEMSVGYYGKLNELPYSTSLIYVRSNEYASPYVGQNYQDDIMIQLNTTPASSFIDFKLETGRYPFGQSADNSVSYCSLGFFDENFGVYGSCWLRRMIYMGEDYGYNALNIFRDGAVYMTVEESGATTLYVVASGLDQTMSTLYYAMKVAGKPKYINRTTGSQNLPTGMKGAERVIY